MKYNPIALMSPIQSHADFAERVAMVRQAESEAGTKYPNTTEAIMLEYENFREDGEFGDGVTVRRIPS